MDWLTGIVESSSSVCRGFFQDQLVEGVRGQEKDKEKAALYPCVSVNDKKRTRSPPRALILWLCWPCLV